jgi:hypothetical protein
VIFQKLQVLAKKPWTKVWPGLFCFNNNLIIKKIKYILRHMFGWSFIRFLNIYAKVEYILEGTLELRVTTHYLSGDFL